MKNTSDHPDSVSPLDLAKLAAIIDPTACRSGNSREALFNAAALLEESFTFCRKLEEHRGVSNLSDWLTLEALGGSAGASNLFKAIAKPILSAPSPVLTLATKDPQDDTLRPYLEEKANFEGKQGRKAWSNVRTVRDNLRAMHVDFANRHNKLNAERIQKRELLEQEEARTAGCTVEELPARVRYQDTLWNDGDSQYQQFLEQCAARDIDGKIIRYDIPQSVVDELIKWKRTIRQTKGGIKAVRLLSRTDVFGKRVKEKNPKK